jgi:hypothetical protein
MRWLLATIALLAASACLVAWIYLRDRDTSQPLPQPSYLSLHRPAMPDRRRELSDYAQRRQAQPEPAPDAPASRREGRKTVAK